MAEVIVCEVQEKFAYWVLYTFLFVVQCETLKPKCSTDVKSLSLRVVAVVSYNANRSSLLVSKSDQRVFFIQLRYRRGLQRLSSQDQAFLQRAST